jgi:hypothetical protein
MAIMEFHQSFAQAGTLGVLSVCLTTILIRLRNRRELSHAAKVHVNMGLSSTCGVCLSSRTGRGADW